MSNLERIVTFRDIDSFCFRLEDAGIKIGNMEYVIILDEGEYDRFQKEFYRMVNSFSVKRKVVNERIKKFEYRGLIFKIEKL